ncbi:hypothetical protein M9H77_11613 [Catharanthus roseus]|uniref:Uncharacterized protein n=1 Tax=Catharanthus roseus TaxID=4058 RepID=A0ACC0BF28_CATRO|nr:hypothetical protein M9H77_11613 [Catharanthus roseus]
MYFEDRGKMYIVGTRGFSSMKDIKDGKKAFNETVVLAIATLARLVRLKQAIKSTREELLNCNALDCTDSSGPRVTVPRGREKGKFWILGWSSFGEDF